MTGGQLWDENIYQVQSDKAKLRAGMYAGNPSFKIKKGRWRYVTKNTWCSINHLS